MSINILMIPDYAFLFHKYFPIQAEFYFQRKEHISFILIYYYKERNFFVFR